MAEKEKKEEKKEETLVLEINKDLALILSSLISSSNYEMMDPLDGLGLEIEDKERLRGLREKFFRQIKDFASKTNKK